MRCLRDNVCSVHEGFDYSPLSPTCDEEHHNMGAKGDASEAVGIYIA